MVTIIAWIAFILLKQKETLSIMKKHIKVKFFVEL